MTNKPNLDIPETGAATPTPQKTSSKSSPKSSLKTGAATPTSLKTSPKSSPKSSSKPPSPAENPLLAAIREVTIPVLAQTFKLTPAAIASQFTIDEIAEAKQAPPTLIEQRFTDLLLPIGLTWAAIEQMSDYHRDAFYQLLLMKPPE